MSTSKNKLLISDKKIELCDIPCLISQDLLTDILRKYQVKSYTPYIIKSINNIICYALGCIYSLSSSKRNKIITREKIRKNIKKIIPDYKVLRINDKEYAEKRILNKKSFNFYCVNICHNLKESDRKIPIKEDAADELAYFIEKYIIKKYIFFAKKIMKEIKTEKLNKKIDKQINFYEVYLECSLIHCLKK